MRLSRSTLSPAGNSLSLWQEPSCQHSLADSDPLMLSEVLTVALACHGVTKQEPCFCIQSTLMSIARSVADATMPGPQSSCGLAHLRLNGWQSFAVVPSARTSLSLSQCAVGEDWVCGRSNTACSTMFQTCAQLYWCQVYSKILGSVFWRAMLAIGVCDWSSYGRITTTLLPGL